jgi:uncharacterized protein YeaO (DUF488 family)
MYRHRPPGAGPLPKGIRRDTRYRFSHILRPTKEIVEAYLADPTNAAWRTFKRKYLAILDMRFRENRTPFDDLARRAAENNVFLGCNCPTKKNPVLGHCHTYLALGFMKKHYPRLKVVIPSPEK